MTIISRVRRSVRQTITEPMAWVDKNAFLPPGRVDPTTRITIVLLVAALVLTLMSYGVLDHHTQYAAADAFIAGMSAISADLGASLLEYRELLRMIAWSLGALAVYVALPALIVRRVFGHRLRDYGLNLDGFRRHLWIYALLFLPVFIAVLGVASAPAFQAKYPFYKEPHGVVDFIIWECFYALQFFCLEFFFRGFLIHGVKDKFGRHAAFIMVLPYVMIHFSKPLYESLGAIIAGSVLGILSLRTGSIAGGVLIHVGVAITMDIAALLLSG